MNNPFWTLTLGTLSIVAAVMFYLGWLARKVPEAQEKSHPRRLNPDQIRLLAYGLMVLALLLGAMYELSLYRDPLPPDEVAPTAAAK